MFRPPTCPENRNRYDMSLQGASFPEPGRCQNDDYTAADCYSIKGATMKERSKPSQLLYAASFLLAILTTFNMMLSTGEPGGLALLVFGLATGANAGILLLEALKHYGSAYGGKLSGGTRLRMAFVSGVLFGAALTPAIAIDGSFPFMVGLVVGAGFSDRVRRTLRRWMRMGRNTAADPAHDPDDGNDIRMPEFANDSTGQQLAAAAMMMLGFVLAAGVALGVYAGFLGLVRRFPG